MEESLRLNYIHENYDLLDLIKYRDAGMHTYTYFYTINNRVVSPYFDAEEEAKAWLQNNS